MANLTITSAKRTGQTVVVKGTAASGPVTVSLILGGVPQQTKNATVNPDGTWEVTFNPASNTATHARASEPGGKQVEAPIT